jgi:glycosyltransferase involved in cell wall biosynthesis
MVDLAVLAPDPAFGGGVTAQTEAFLAGAQRLGRRPALVYDAQPTLAGHALTINRVESVRQLRAARRLGPRLRSARSLWVVAPLAMHGFAATRAGVPYGCWVGASLYDEWRGRARSLDPLRTAAQMVNIPLLRRLERAVVRRAARVYATSPHARATIAAATGIDESWIELLPIPVDVDVFTPEADERWLARLEAPTIAFVGRGADPRKNLPLLLAALPLIRARLPAARVRLIGSTPATLPAGVEALGSVTSIAEPLRECSLLVLPSWQEGFGIVAAEALACGVPVVTTPSGGPEHLVRASGGGRILAGWGASELADTVTELLTDAGTLARMRATGREYVLREHSPAQFRTLLACALAAVDGR